MAKHTELLADYLADGGDLPTIFSEITGFENLFKLHYCDKEIGFETRALFRMKLEEKANIYIPLYKIRINALATAILGIDNPTKTTYTTDDLEHNQGAQQDSISTYGTNTQGEQSASKTDLPYNGVTDTPAEVTHADATTNTNAQTTSNSYGLRKDTDNRKISRAESGFSLDEKLKQLEYLNSGVHSLVMSCLREFKNIFMGVY